MKIFESASAFEIIPREEDELTWPRMGPLYGKHIVFGEEGNFEELYHRLVLLPELGLSEEDVKKHIPEEEWDRRLGDLDLEQLKADAGRVLHKDLYPDYDPEKLSEFDWAAQTDPDRVFLKEKSLLVTDSDDLGDLRDLKEDMLKELRACEIINEAPHANIAKYLGCRVQSNRVTGIYYERCVDMDDMKTPLNVEKYVEDIGKGIEHLHTLGYCHNDITPNNIMLRDNDTAVLVDFDGCLPVGEKSGKRACIP